MSTRAIDRSGIGLLLLLKDTGHGVLEERPKETTEALVNFL